MVRKAVLTPQRDQDGRARRHGSSTGRGPRFLLTVPGHLTVMGQKGGRGDAKYATDSKRRRQLRVFQHATPARAGVDAFRYCAI
eukprot:5063861-Prymnesium_polylepis.1